MSQAIGCILSGMLAFFASGEVSDSADASEKGSPAVVEVAPFVLLPPGVETTLPEATEKKADNPESEIISPGATRAIQRAEQLGRRPLANGSGAVMPDAGTFFLAIGAVLILLGGLYWFLRKYVRKGRFLGASTIRVLATKPLAPKQHVFLVEVGPKVFLVGATKDQMTTLGEFSSPEDVASVRGASPAYAENASSGVFNQALKEGIQSAETRPASRESYDNLFQELGQIRNTVMSWKA